MLLSFFRGIYFKPRSNLISISGKIKKVLPESRGFDKNPPFSNMRKSCDSLLCNNVAVHHEKPQISLGISSATCNFLGGGGGSGSSDPHLDPPMLLCTILSLFLCDFHYRSHIQLTLCKTAILKKPKIGFQYQLSLDAGQKYCRMLQGDSAILSTFIKLPFVIKIFVVPIFEWPFYTGFTVGHTYITTRKVFR